MTSSAPLGTVTAGKELPAGRPVVPWMPHPSSKALPAPGTPRMKTLLGSPGEVRRTGGQCGASACRPGEGPTHLVQVEGAGAHEGHGMVQVVVVHAVWWSWKGTTLREQGAHTARALLVSRTSRRTVRPPWQTAAWQSQRLSMPARLQGHRRQSIQGPGHSPASPFTGSSTRHSCHPHWYWPQSAAGYLQAPAPALLTCRLGVPGGAS